MNADPRHNGQKRQSTVLESVEEIRAQLRGDAADSRSGSRPAASEAANESRRDDALAFRPSMRPPMALLVALDDGDDSGEIVRVRSDAFVLGRVSGDLVIPHDMGMSSQHAEIVRRAEGREYFWFLRDLGSTNGTFVRTSTVHLHHNQEFLIGGRRLRYDHSVPLLSRATPDEAGSRATNRWEIASAGNHAAVVLPEIVDITPGKPERRFPLKGSEAWLGRDPKESAIHFDDQMLAGRHARIYKDEKSGRWVLESGRTRNGVWARVAEVHLGRGAFFQCGEQRFLIKIL